MANTFTKIASYTVSGSSTATYTFSSIPSTYTDLIVKFSARNTDTGGGAILVYFNSDTTNYSWKRVMGSGAAASSSSGSTTNIYYIDSNDWTTNTFANGEIYIPNYAGSTNKSYSIDIVTENNATTSYQTLQAGLWSNTSAISSITFNATGALNFVENTTFYLYGISNS